MSNDAFLVIDAGSGSVKSFLISPKGAILNRAERDWDRDNWNTREAWSRIVDSVIEITIAKSCYILSISCTSMREEFVLIDENGDEIKYQLDEESEKHGYTTLEKHGEEMYNTSGHWPVPNWIAGAILPWIAETQPKKIAKTSKILLISDWLNYKLTGITATEGSSSCETSLFDLRKYDWDWDIIDKLGLYRDIFPHVLGNGEVIGYVKPEIALETGLNEDVPVVMGGADTQCGLLGMGTVEGEIGAVGGTTTPVQVITDTTVFDNEKRTWTNNHLVPGLWILESNVGYTGRGVRWLRDTHGDGSVNYDDLSEMACDVPIGCNGVLAFLGPHLFDNRPPYWPMDKLGDLPIEHTILGDHGNDLGVLTRAIFEANSFGVKANLEQIKEVSDMEFDLIRFCGGNSKSDLWMQIQADVLGIPVHIPLIHDASAIGAAVLAAYGTGYYVDLDTAIANMVQPGRTYMPRDQCVDDYAACYRRWMNTRSRLGSSE